MQAEMFIAKMFHDNVRYVDTITGYNQTFQVYVNGRYVYFDVMPDDVIPITHYHTIYNDYTFQTGRYYYSPSLRYIFEPINVYFTINTTNDSTLYKLLPVDNCDVFYGDNNLIDYCNLCDINRKYIKVHIDRVGLYN